MATASARGVLFVHSAPRALCPHIEWAAGRAIDRAVNFDWIDQPVLRGTQRAEFVWEGEAGSGAKIASALRGWEHLRFEVTEDPSTGVDGHRWCHTPQLGLWSGAMSAPSTIRILWVRAAIAAPSTSGEGR